MENYKPATKTEVLKKAKDILTLGVFIALCEYLATMNVLTAIIVLAIVITITLVNIIFNSKTYVTCKCGTTTSFRDNYCRKCGNKLNEN